MFIYTNIQNNIIYLNIYIDNIQKLLYNIITQNNIMLLGKKFIVRCKVMSKINVQLLLTQEEFNSLKVKADKVGLSVPLYIKGEVLDDSEFNKCYKKLLEKVDALPSGTRYNIRALFGVEWTMAKGIKLNLGKTYYNSICSGSITNAKAVGKDGSAIMWYEKI